MDEGREFESEIFEHGSVFDITSLEPRMERWRQLLLLALGLASVWLGHEISTWASDPGANRVRLWTAAVVLFGLVQVGRAVSRFVTSVSSRQSRVFPWRHLAGCGVCLLAVAVTLITSLLVWDPFSSLLSRGQVTSADIADVGSAFAAGLCLIGAFIAFVAAAADFRAERAWRDL